MFAPKRNILAVILSVIYTNAYCGSGVILHSESIADSTSVLSWTGLTNTSLSKDDDAPLSAMAVEALKRHKITSKSNTETLIKFNFSAGDDSDDAWAEARFTLDKAYQDLTFIFWLYIPENYEHRDSPGTDNNKFLRLWENSYSDIEKVGLSLMPDHEGSLIGSDFVQLNYTSISTAVTQSNGFITKDDLGKWIQVIIEVSAPDETKNGMIQVFKNGKRVLTETAIQNRSNETSGFKEGYLLGWSNSGFDNDTVMIIDDLIIYDGIQSPPVMPTKVLTSR